jgi:hypothetical protein
MDDLQWMLKRVNEILQSDDKGPVGSGQSAVQIEKKVKTLRDEIKQRLTDGAKD